MIKLKDKINKSVALRTIRRDAEKIYKESWQPELQIEAYVKGAEAILNYLHIPHVSNNEERVAVCCDVPNNIQRAKHTGREYCVKCGKPQ